MYLIHVEDVVQADIIYAIGQCREVLALIGRGSAKVVHRNYDNGMFTDFEIIE